MTRSSRSKDGSVSRIGRPPTGLPRRSKQIKIQVTEELYALVAASAGREGRTVSDWGMRVFERSVDEEQRPACRWCSPATATTRKERRNGRR